ncbi:hypothetical protein BG004_005109 [Podila humilis]|nr:hypothetical protein BG004_005109 [Podila humilis]
MRIYAIATIIAATIAVASAALPVEPVNAFVLQQDNANQHVVQERKPFDLTIAESSSSSAAALGSPKVKAPSPKTGYRHQNAIFRSMPLPIVDFDTLPGAPTSPLPIPNVPSPSAPNSPLPLPPPSPTTRAPPRKASNDKMESPLSPMSGSLRPPPRPSTQSPGPRPRSIVSHLALSSPPSHGLPPVPVILHSADSIYGSSTPTTPTSPISPTSPTSPVFAGQYTAFATKQLQLQELSLSTSLPSTTLRPQTGSNRRTIHTGDTLPTDSERVRKDKQRAREPSYPSSLSSAGTESVIANKGNSRSASASVSANASTDDLCNQDKTAAMTFTSVKIDSFPRRPVGLVATRFYGIESSMRWREGVDPVEKRFTSSNGAWRCQDRFAIFFRPGDQIGPDQVVTKTFWSEAWPYPIETLLYGTVSSTDASSQHNSASAVSGHRSDHESDHQLSRTRAGAAGYGGGGGSSGQQLLKSAASFPPMVKSRDPRYITSAGVQKIAKVTIPMPDVSIDQMDLVKAPIKVELRIFILESPLRIHATAFLLGRIVTGMTELYVVQ